MKIPELHVINYAGFMDLKDEPYYEAKSVLNVEDYPESELIAEEVARRSNCHNGLLEALESVIRLKALIEYPNNTKEKHIGEAMAISGMLAKVENAIKKAKGL